ncbi:ABC transporter ATP-binding protein [Nocardioides ungokensis]|uniref:ABC transporter ATP-binding protein n=1 Tax=Nocardioides ungokensis TaxID=1643322 RepID=UPI001FE287F7|nr:ATP-binding cassette domain-containing protein [Nocardioides ungokensis]
MTARGDVATTIVFDGLTKQFGQTHAVHELSATVRPGVVTAFLGPNGAGKTTTLRMLLGLVTPSRGTATFDGRRYDELSHPVRQVGALLEATGFHPSRTAVNHLRTIAVAARLDPRAPGRVLETVGLADAADRKVGGFSLGMRQRLGLAAALLGDPPVLVLDEPANGLDPHGIRWLREFLCGLAQEGRTVLVSSHVLPEVEQTADDVLLLAHGQLVRQTSLSELRAEHAHGADIRTPHAQELDLLLTAAGYPSSVVGPGRLVADAPPSVVGDLAAAHGIAVHRLVESTVGLEDLFLTLTADVSP